MELQFFGANCIRLATRKARVVVDDSLASVGLKTITKTDDVYLRTSKMLPEHPSRFSADMPGEYEISGVSIHGIAARAHMDEEGKTSAVIYTISADDLKVAVIGHIYPKLTEEQVEQIGVIDVAILPVGGNGYTLDAEGALSVIKQIEPKIFIPSHYADKAIKYEEPQETLAEALKKLGMEPVETLAKYKPSKADLTDTTRLILLERQ